MLILSYFWMHNWMLLYGRKVTEMKFIPPKVNGRLPTPVPNTRSQRGMSHVLRT